MREQRMNGLPGAVLGGDPFCDVFRGLYDARCYWKLTDPDYCLSVMQAAYDGGCRAFEYSFGSVQQLYLRLRERVQEPLSAVGNPTWLQGPKLGGRHLQHCRDRVLATITGGGYLDAATGSYIREKLNTQTPMVFGFDTGAKPLADHEVAAIELDEDVFCARLDELFACDTILIGGTDADWLFSLRRQDVIVRMAELVRARGKTPLLLCHYASLVLPLADGMGLDVDGYLAPVNMQWAWVTHKRGIAAVRQAKKPVIAFMAFACGGLAASLAQAAHYLKDTCGIAGVLYGTTKPANAQATAQLLCGLFGA